MKNNLYTFLKKIGVKKLPYYDSMVKKAEALAIKLQSNGEFCKSSINGNDFWIGKDRIDPHTRSIWRDGTWEEHTTELVKNQIGKGEKVVDVGACMGYFTVLFADLVGPKGKVTAFEPEPTNYELLEKNTDFFTNTETEKIIVSESEGREKLYLSEKGGQHSIFKDDFTRNGTIKVEKVSLDSYFSNQIDFLKIDVEGAEPEVLKGYKKGLKKYKPDILFEINYRWENENEKLFEFLKSLGYSFYGFDQQNDNEFTSMTVDDLIKQVQTSRVLIESNVFCSIEKPKMEVKKPHE